MTITIYHFPPSAPSRAAVLTARVLNLDVDIKTVNLFEKAQLQDDFIKVNPQHTVPTLDDNGFILWESRAISGYLTSVYGKNDNLYPKEPKKKALVDQRLYFDCGTLYPRIRAICFPVLFLGETKIADDKRTSLNEALNLLNLFLDGHQWVAGNNMTIADISILTSVTSIEAVGWDLLQFPNIQQWLVSCSKEMKGFDENKDGAGIFGNAVKCKLEPGQL